METDTIQQEEYSKFSMTAKPKKVLQSLFCLKKCNVATVYIVFLTKRFIKVDLVKKIYYTIM